MKPLTLTGKDILKFKAICEEVAAAITDTTERAEARVEAVADKKGWYSITTPHRKNIIEYCSKHYYGLHRDLVLQMTQLVGVFNARGKRKTASTHTLFDTLTYGVLLWNMSETELDHVISDYNAALSCPFIRIAISDILLKYSSYYQIADLEDATPLAQYRYLLGVYRKLAKKYAGVVATKWFFPILKLNEVKRPAFGRHGAVNNNVTWLSIRKESIDYLCGIQSEDRTELRWYVAISASVFMRPDPRKSRIVAKILHAKKGTFLSMNRLLNAGTIPGSRKNVVATLRNKIAEDNDSSIIRKVNEIRMKETICVMKKEGLVQDIHAIVVYILDGEAIHVIHEQDGSRSVNNASSITKMILNADWNHKKQPELRAKAEVRMKEEYRKEHYLPTPSGYGPVHAEQYRLKTIGAIRDAGTECGHCVGSCAKSTDVWIYRKDDVVAGVRVADNEVFQCYDAGNTITPASIEFKEELQHLIAISSQKLESLIEKKAI